MMNQGAILGERLRRHHLVGRIGKAVAYWELFRLCQPVSTIHNTRPGAPPSLRPRAEFEDRTLTEKFRRRHQLVKGRFLGGGIGYVLASDLPVYANVFRKPLTSLTADQQTVLAALRSCGPLAPRQIKEETGLLNKVIMPALHRLQTAFLVFEDQTDSDWERPWSLFAGEWPDVVLAEDLRVPCAVEVLARFLRVNVFATLEQIGDWTQLPSRFLRSAIAVMQAKRLVAVATVDGLGNGYMLPEDLSLGDSQPARSVFMLHRADPLVRAHATELKHRFRRQEVLQYLLVDGEFSGAVAGHWRIGPTDVEDICLFLSPAECRRRRDEILSVVSPEYSPPRGRILRYCGRRLRQ